MSEESTEASQLYHEIHAIVKRWCSEGDKLAAFGVIGALEAVKLDVADTLKRYNDRIADEESDG